MILGPNEVLVVCSTLGQVNKVTILQHLRLAAKVILLQSNVRSAKVNNGSSEVKSESNKVKSGSSGGVNNGSSEVNNGSSEVNNGSSEVNNGSSEVNNGSSEVNNGSTFLFTPIRTYPPSTIHQLVVKDWSIVLDKAYGHHDLIKDTKTHNYQTLYRRALERGGLRENEGATTDTKITPSDFLNRDIAVVMGEPGVFHTLNTIKGPDGRCLLTYSHQAIAEEFAGLAVPKRSLLKPIIDNK
ncbi:hypothetical protein Pmani_019171 [Petrolisthes manimaculis]|uniref:Uncharacterized protein n=1 Tax=Petrolisthes manimaculis TaxID=1843537 RepID=A0AAE1PKY7_9EUCA|nr:hypothetical protein Pmani_019171 [Petrolisthes manimaculis]